MGLLADTAHYLFNCILRAINCQLVADGNDTYTLHFVPEKSASCEVANYSFSFLSQ